MDKIPFLGDGDSLSFAFVGEGDSFSFPAVFFFPFVAELFDGVSLISAFEESDGDISGGISSASTLTSKDKHIWLVK